ncbi:hypothetical protein [Maribellus mangrovi]|uniref:hypothetical protein n=1 Tax=Maribellus mangrovi TaxID=3133146 RepID=UPI0030EE6A46
MKALFSFVLICLCVFEVKAQSHHIELQIQNQPENPIVLGWIKGDNFFKIDSVQATNGVVRFDLPDDAHTGVYRMILGKTGYARVMNEGPQQLDFIYNNEDINLRTDFKVPVEVLQVIRSEENSFYYDFMQRQSEYEKAISLMEQEVNHYWLDNDTAKAISLSNEFNQLQMEWDLRIVQAMQLHADLYASKLIGAKRVPLKDGFLSPEERKEALKANFFNHTDFSDESLMYSQALTDKVFDYLVLFNDKSYTQQQRTAAYKKAVDVVLSLTNKNPVVYDFIVQYLIHGFDVLDLQEVIAHIEATK